MTIPHSTLSGDQLHGAFRIVFANDADRTADTGPYLASESLWGGGTPALALQSDTMAIYALQTHNPVTWVPVSGGSGGGGGGGNVIERNTDPAALGTAAAGVGTTVSASDHVHPLPTASLLGLPLRATFANDGERGADAGPWAPSDSIAGGSTQPAIALQLDTLQLYVLANDSPIAWSPTGPAIETVNPPESPDETASAGFAATVSASDHVHPPTTVRQLQGDPQTVSGTLDPTGADATDPIEFTSLLDTVLFDADWSGAGAGFTSAFTWQTSDDYAGGDPALATWYDYGGPSFDAQPGGADLAVSQTFGYAKGWFRVAIDPSVVGTTAFPYTLERNGP
jgi:hypothetical protein